MKGGKGRIGFSLRQGFKFDKDDAVIFGASTSLKLVGQQ